MKVRIPKNNNSGMGNIQELAKKAQKLQEEMDQATKQLEEKLYNSSVGGGVVNVTINGKLELTSLKIDPEIINPDDIEMLSDLIISGVNQAISQASKEKDSVMEKISGQMNIPGLL